MSYRSIILRARHRRAISHAVVLCSLLCLFTSRLAHAECQLCTDASRRGSQCPPWAVCSVHLGACESGLAPADVCTGCCTAGATTRLVLEVGVYAASDMPEAVGARFGAEVVPPFAGGHLAIHGEWWTGGLWRFGPRLSWPLLDSARVGAGVDIGHRAGEWGAGVSARIEYFPWSLSPTLIPLQFVSLSLEAGALVLDSSSNSRPVHLILGLRVWL